MEETNVNAAVTMPNIALIKYWGRRDRMINLPFNSSLSLTLDYSLKTITGVILDKNKRNDTLYINGKKIGINQKEEKISNLRTVIEEMKSIAGLNINDKVTVISENSFPMDAGIASSASGGAALVLAMNSALDIGLNNRELSIFARRISGSACRSIYGGIVRWRRGHRKDGTDSYCERIRPQSEWKELVDTIALVNVKKKSISSSMGHDVTANTSPLFKVRPNLAEESIRKAIRCINKKDFESLGQIIMRDSNNMHAAMMDSWPPIMYLNDISKKIMQKIEELNESEGKIIAAYTFDAGPNAHIISLRKNAKKVCETLMEIRAINKILKSSMGEGPVLVNATLTYRNGVPYLTL